METIGWVRTGEPLAAHRLFLSRDLDEARDVVSRTFCPHRLTLARTDERLDTVHNHVAGRDMSLNYLRYGAGVIIEPGELGRFYLVQVPIRGSASVQNGRREVAAGGATATILNPTLATRMAWSGDCEKLLIQIDRAALHRVAEALTGHDLPLPVIFDPALSLEAETTGAWARKAAACFAAAEAGHAFGSEAGQRQALIEETLITALIAAQPSNIRHLVQDRAAGPSSRQVKRGQAYIHARLSEPLTIAEVAEAAGCSLRSLQLGFQQHFGCSPLAYLRRQRLGLARYALASAGERTTVGDVAHAVGYTHLGRFSRDYRAAYGCTPRLSLKAADAMH